MQLRLRLMLWLLRHRRKAYLKLKKLNSLAVSQDTEFLDIHAELLANGRGSLTFHERYNLYKLAKATSRLTGAIGEAGVYRGGSARILCAGKGESPMYLFDTFEGMPAVNAATDGRFRAGEFNDTGVEDVRRYLSKFGDVFLYPGLFPGSAIGKEPSRQKFRFVHLDLDLYQSTYDGLVFFYPRTVPRGIIVSHDYSNLGVPGVRKAFADFFQDKPEPILPLWDTQCAIVKM